MIENNTLPKIDREEAKRRAEDEARRADLKQHADKLIQGFEKLEDSHAKRAIWELFQNAIDLSDNSDVIIKLNDDSIVFEHNGKPFTTKTLSCLIKQVSSKNAQNNEDEVGQYGTGFITTHSFGKRILISGSLKEGDYFISLDNFDIDRIAQNSDPELIDKLLIQQKEVFNLVVDGDLRRDCAPYTTFSYQTVSSIEKQNAENAVSSLSVILPYVMMINKKLQSVTVYDRKGIKTTYKKEIALKEEDLDVTIVYINEERKKIYSIYSEKKDITIILPLSQKNNAIVFDENLSKLFLFYPLIGTENFGFNYIIHSKQFAPTEPRDGIHLKSKNEQVQEKEQNNRAILEVVLDTISNFVEKNCLHIQNTIHLAYLNFNTTNSNSLIADYYKSLKREWVTRFKYFELVESNNKKIKPESSYFLSEKLLQEEKYLDSIYSLVSLFWTDIPNKEICLDWTKIVLNWEDETIKFIEIKDLIEKIEEIKSLDRFENPLQLREFYTYLIEIKESEFFNKKRLLPNIKNEFRLQSELNTPLHIDESLIKVADIIMPDIPQRYINPIFSFDLSFESYGRKQFSKDFNSKVSELNKTINQNSLLDIEILYSLIDYCKIFPSIDKSGTRGKLMKLICTYYKRDTSFIELPGITDQEIEWLTPIKCLLRNFIWELNTKDQCWTEENILFLKDVISVINDYYEYDDIVQTSPILPNQLFKLCKKSELKLDDKIPEELKDLYDNIVKPTLSIKNTLVLDNFHSFINKNEVRNSFDLGAEIEREMQRNKRITEINGHPYEKDILWIIKKISDDPDWSKYFQNIEEKKASIMLERISDDETKNDLFSIIGLNKEKITLLGELSRKEDLERIIDLGLQAIEEEKRNITDFQFKHKIGTHIERLIKDRIGRELEDLKIEVREQQGGQDIIIEYQGTIVYYVEVKSRWDAKSSITMSPLQMKNAVKNKRKYSLCCVDMANYEVGNSERYTVSDLNIIFDRINFINDIGDKIKPLLEPILLVEDDENEVSLTGDYRGIIPQAIVKEGSTIDSFVEHIISLLKL